MLGICRHSEEINVGSFDMDITGTTCAQTEYDDTWETHAYNGIECSNGNIKGGIRFDQNPRRKEWMGVTFTLLLFHWRLVMHNQRKKYFYLFTKKLQYVYSQNKCMEQWRWHSTLPLEKAVDKIGTWSCQNFTPLTIIDWSHEYHCNFKWTRWTIQGPSH